MEQEIFITRIQNIIKQTRHDYLNIPENILSEKINPGKWSKREILGHLIDSARYNLMRFTEIPDCESVFEIKSYKQDDLVKRNKYQHQNDHDLLTMWQILNHQIIIVLSNLSEDEWNRTIKMKNEIQTLKGLAEDYVHHTEHHIQQIFCNINSSLFTPCQIKLANAKSTLALESGSKDVEFVKLLQFGDLEIEYYKPNKWDKQLPHLKDEIYVIISGEGTFYINGQKFPFSECDVLFVKAGDDHRFLDFTDDFSTWVVFFGVSN